MNKRWSWTDDNCPGKYPQCTSENIRTRVNFANMQPQDRKAYTDAVLCIQSLPSNLDNAEYPAATSRYLDYAVIHVNRTQMVHIDGFFLTWHRYFLQLYEDDLRYSCGYEGPFPYWDFSQTPDILTSPVFDGSEYSMSGDGAPNNTGPIILGPSLQIPHGTGGGCVTSGPFANYQTTMLPIDPSFIINGSLPATAFDYNPSCLIRDLNQYVIDTYTTAAQTSAAVHSTGAEGLEFNLNGVIGSSSLGIHSGAHFSIGGPMDSIHVSPQDPIWYPLHTMIDRVFTSYQAANPSVAEQTSDTGTALNVPPSPNVTLASIEPDWGYFDLSSIMVGELMSTTAGPFCYQYDSLIT